MHAFEWVASVYFLALAAAASGVTEAGRRRAMVAIASALMAVAVAAASRLRYTFVPAWLPHVYLIAGYWLPALLVTAPRTATRFEAWLVRTDAKWRPRLPSAPKAMVPVLEMAYLSCYPLVPASFLVVWMAGDSADVDRFWLAVLASGFACYGWLPWLVSRPPRLLADVPSPAPRLGAVNALVLGRVSHQLNTFPSGHVAVSCAAAAMVTTVSPGAGIVVTIVAAAIAIGAVTGRYHYVVDVVVGVIVSAVILVIVAATS